MKHVHLAALLCLIVAPAVASPASADKPPKPIVNPPKGAPAHPATPATAPMPPARPDADKKVTLTVGELAQIIAKAQAQGHAQAEFQSAQQEMQDLLKDPIAKASP